MDYKAFLCHSSRQSGFVIEVCKYLRKSLYDIFIYEEYQKENNYVTTLDNKIRESNIMIIFADKEEPTDWQRLEIDRAIKKYRKGDYKVVIVTLKDLNLNDSIYEFFSVPRNVIIDKFDIKFARKTASEILDRLKLPFIGDDGLPFYPQIFNYEKDILKYFKDKLILDRKIASNEELTKEDLVKLNLIREYTLKGCPSNWVYIKKWFDNKKSKNSFKKIKNEIQNVIGNFRPHDAQISVDARIDCDYESSLYFIEAGPREFHFFPQKQNTLKIAIMVSGGIAPGINSVIDGITQRHKLYAVNGKYSLKVLGLKNGFFAFDDIENSHLKLVKNETNEYVNTKEYVNQGGSLLGTSRVEELIDGVNRMEDLKDIVNKLRGNSIDILYIIGGDGSMRAAHAIHSIAENDCEAKKKLSVIAIPKTMDNDILWMWQSFGFISAVEKAREVIENLATEVKSNPRLCIVQLFGSNSGFIVSHAVLASKVGGCDAALIPEEDFNMVWLKECITKKMKHRYLDQNSENIPYGLIVMSETAIPTDAEKFFENEHVGLTQIEKEAVKEFLRHKEEKQGFQGKTSDHLRNAGLKIIARGLEYLIINDKNLPRTIGEIKWDKLRVFTNEPRHLLRSAAPSTLDIINGSRLGTLAVDNAMAGYTDFMISQWLTEFVLVPLELVTLGRKQIPSEGIFWKSVLAKTGQGKYIPNTQK